MADISSFTTALGISKAELCRRLGLDSKSNTLSLYDKGKSNPPYEMCKKLLELGMTVEELFGPEIAAKVVISRNPLRDAQAAYNAKINFDDPAVQAGLKKALGDIFTQAASDKR